MTLSHTTVQNLFVCLFIHSLVCLSICPFIYLFIIGKKSPMLTKAAFIWSKIPFGTTWLHPKLVLKKNKQTKTFPLSSSPDETIVAISVILAPNRWSCVIQWDRFKDGCCHSLANKDSLRSFSDSVRNSAWSSHSVFAATTHVYWTANKNVTWN